MIFASTLFPIAVSAQAELPRPQCTNLGGVRCEDLGPIDLIVKVINFLLAVAFIIAVLFLIIGGFRYIISGGNAEAAEAGKNTIFNALIGIAIIILAYVIVSVVTRTATRAGNPGGTI